MKCTGMRWTVAGANPVLWLRCARLGGWLGDYWDDRVARLAASAHRSARCRVINARFRSAQFGLMHVVQHADASV